MTPWWTGIRPAETSVVCGEETHRLAWRSGELRALDHADADGERSLAALGGPPCRCVELLDAWQRHAADPRVLIRASRGPTDILNLDDGGSPAMRPPRPGRSRPGRPRPAVVGWVSSVPLGRAAQRSNPGRPSTYDPDDELILLLGLGAGLPDRLQASVIATWTSRLEQPDAECVRLRPQLEAALYGRVAAALRAWAGRAELDFDLLMIPPSIPADPTANEAADPTANPTANPTAGRPAASKPGLARSGEDRLLVELPFAWLADVWARGLASVMGRFCLAATTTDGREWTLSTVGPELGRPQTITLRLSQADDGGR